MSRIATRSGRTIPAALLALVVLAVAMAGSATAAALITGKQIKNNTVTTQDIKNKSLKGADVKNESLTGADVRNGTLAAADLAANAKNEVRFDEKGGFLIPTCIDTSLDNCSSLAITGLSPGTWLVTATVAVDNFNGPATSIINRCGIWRDGVTLAETRTALGANAAPGEVDSISLQQVIVATDGSTPVSLKCTEMGGESLHVSDPTITALKVS